MRLNQERAFSYYLAENTPIAMCPILLAALGPGVYSDTNRDVYRKQKERGI
jgi:hypothetical protein